MKAFKIALMFLLAITMVSTALALPITVDKVEVDDVELQVNAVNRFDVLRGDKLEVEVIFTPQQNIDDMQIDAFFSGDEHNDVAPSYDATPTFDADANVTYRKKLTIDLHEFFEEDDYKLRIIFSDRNGQELVQNYNIKIDVPRHGMMIRDVIFNPSSRVKAGSALLGVVRVRNTGEKDQEDIKVTMGIPRMNLYTSGFVEEIENNDDEKSSEELFLQLSHCAQPGVYDVEIEVSFDDGFRKERTTRQIEVTNDETCEDGVVTGSTKAKTTISVGSQLESVAQGATAVFPLTITNAARTSKSYTVSVQAGGWADVKISPTSTMVIDGGKTQTVYVFVTPDKKAPVGAQVLTATASSNGQKLEDITLTANVAKSGSTFRSLLEWGLIIMVVLLVVLGLIIGFSRLKGDEDDQQPSQPQAYY